MNYAKGKRVVTAFAGTAAAQALMQLIGFAISVTVIRTLPQSEYAIFTVALSIQGAMAALADSGVGPNIVAQGGRVWSNREQLGAVVKAGNRLRWQLASITVPFVAAIGFGIIYYQLGNGPAAYLAIVAALLTFLASHRTVVLEAPLNLNQALQPLIGLRFLGAVLRALGSLIALFILPAAWSVICVNAAVQMTTNALLLGFTRKYADLSQVPSSAALMEMKKVVWRSFPSTLYFAIQPQITLWILAAFSMSSGVAEIGALGRLAAITAIVTVTFDAIIVPRLARSTPENLLSSVQRALLGALLLITSGATAAWIFSSEILGVLGSKYEHLNHEFNILILSTASGLIASCLWSINSSKGYVPFWYLYPVIDAVSFTSSALYFSLSTPANVLSVQLTGSIVSIVTRTLVFSIMHRKSLSA